MSPNKVCAGPRRGVWPYAPLMRLALAIVLLAGGVWPGTAYAAEVLSAPARAKPPQSAPWRQYLQPGATPTWTTDQLLQNLMQQLDAAWAAQNWSEALRLIDQIIAINPTYDNIAERHYYAHVNYGYQLLTANQCVQSLEQFQQALTLRPSGQEALTGMELWQRYCATPVPTATPPVPTPVGPTITPPVPGPTATPQTLTSPITYTVRSGDTLFGLARRYGTTVQAIMQANGMMSYYLRAGALIWIPASGTPSVGPLVHIVQPGETLTSIAKQYNTTVWAIMSANGLTSYSVWAYRALFIPTIMQPGPIIHIVMPGETLYTIAGRYGATVPLIMLANGLTTYELYVYQRVVIPPPGWTGWPAGSPGLWPGMPLNPGNTYVVQPGDTLYSIARRFGTTAAALMSANGLHSAVIVPGMVLRIP